MQKSNRQNTYNTLINWHSFRLRLVAEGIGIGIVTGCIIVLYRFALEKASHLLTQVYYSMTLKPILILPWIILLLLVAYCVGRVLKYDPMISGSGIPQVKGV